MSEHQYYEFQAIDRPLTYEEQKAVARLSSRVDPHPRRAVFTYHWSDFHGNAEEILARYYDAMIYVASWNHIRLMFRFPRSVDLLVKLRDLAEYKGQTAEFETRVGQIRARSKPSSALLRRMNEAGL